MDWYDRYFTQEWEQRFLKLARKRFFGNHALAEDACQNAWIALRQKLQNLPKEYPDAYVLTAFKNLLLDEYRNHFGRCRPYRWVKELGPFWVKIGELLCLEKLTPAEIADRLCHDNDTRPASPCGERVEEAVRCMKVKQHCSTMERLESEWPEGYEAADQRSDPDQLMPDHERMQFVRTLLAMNNEIPEEAQAIVADRIVARWRAIAEQIDLSDEERLILIRVYMEGDTVAAVARDLHRKPHQVHRPLAHALQRIRMVLERHAVTGEALYD